MYSSSGIAAGGLGQGFSAVSGLEHEFGDAGFSACAWSVSAAACHLLTDTFDLIWGQTGIFTRVLRFPGLAEGAIRARFGNMLHCWLGNIRENAFGQLPRVPTGTYEIADLNLRI
jgi:hypothetical protein